MHSWLAMAIASGFLLGLWDITKKKALSTNSVLNVLCFYSLFSLALISFEFPNALNISSDKIFIIFIKSIIIFFSWACGFSALKNLPISVITPFDTINPLFTIILGILFLNENLNLMQIIGISIMLISYYFISKVGSNEVTNIFKNKYLYLMFLSAILSAVSATIDKIALRSINSGQMQFWFSLFMSLLYSTAFIYSKLRKLNNKPFKFSIYIPLMSIILLISDRIYFNAVNMQSSQISVVIPLRKISILVSVIIGGILFKEKNLKKKFWCICLLITGIFFVFLAK